MNIREEHARHLENVAYVDRRSLPDLVLLQEAAGFILALALATGREDFPDLHRIFRDRDIKHLLLAGGSRDERDVLGRLALVAHFSEQDRGPPSLIAQAREKSTSKRRPRAAIDARREPQRLDGDLLLVGSCLVCLDLLV